MSEAPVFFRSVGRREVMAGFFGRLIRERGQDCSLNIAAAARLAGLEDSEWMAVEEGTVPTDKARLHAMANALEMDWDGMMMFVLLCHPAWES